MLLSTKNNPQVEGCCSETEIRRGFVCLTAGRITEINFLVGFFITPRATKANKAIAPTAIIVLGISNFLTGFLNIFEISTTTRIPRTTKVNIQVDSLQIGYLNTSFGTKEANPIPVSIVIPKAATTCRLLRPISAMTTVNRGMNAVGNLAAPHDQLR